MTGVAEDRENIAAALARVMEQMNDCVNRLVLIQAGFMAVPVDEAQVRADEREKVAAYLEGIRWESGNGTMRRPTNFHVAARSVRAMPAPAAHTGTHACCTTCSNTATSNWYRDNPRDEGVARD